MMQSEGTSLTGSAGHADWPRVPLGEVGDIVSGVTLGRKLRDGATRRVPYLRVANVKDGYLDLSDVYEIEATEAEVEKLRLRRGDLLLTEGGDADKLGRGTFWQEELPVCIHQNHIFRVRFDPEHFCPEFIAAQIGSPYGKAYFLRHAKQTTGIATINQRVLAGFPLLVPPLSEQRGIAVLLKEQLAAVDKARRAAQERLAAAEALPGAFYRQYFGEEPCLSANPLPPTTPTRAGWKWCRLTDLARLATGHTPSRRRPEYWGGDIPWIQLPDIRALDGRRATETSERTNQFGLDNSAAVLLPAGTVCLSRTASVGFVTIMGRPMATSQDFVNWVCGPDLDPDFLMRLLIASRRSIRDLGSGAVHHTIYFPTVEAFSVCVPPLDEQRRIAAALSERLAAAEALEARIREELAAIDALPAALLRQAFGEAGPEA